MAAETINGLRAEIARLEFFAAGCVAAGGDQVRRIETYRAALKELVTILSGVEDMKDAEGNMLLYSTYVDPFGAINDARELLGMPRRPCP